MKVDLSSLNKKQIEGVMALEGPVLIISGPGSGKTRCLTYRIAYMISMGIRPENILGVTFTNKSASEIKERIQKLLGYGQEKSGNPVIRPTIGTFHSIGLQILRHEIPQLGYKRSFTVFDTDDQISLVRRVMAELEIDTKSFNPKIILYKISELKTQLTSPESYEPKDFYSEILAKIYKKYQKELEGLNAVDFDDLIVLPIKIFRQNDSTLLKYQGFWKYILVDEYQDTSHDQYTFINLLAQKYRNLFCIGDDAQSIYQFRRADIRNILNFQRDYPEAKIVMLEQNYRSTKNIITAAQEIISKNKNQIPKSLWTDNDHGNKLVVSETINERHEANLVISKITDLTSGGYSAKDFAVLYRTHAQSRALEEALIIHGLPYQIIGGLKFYERKEIKDILAYLRLIINPSDSIALDRIYNIPARGIGKSIIDKVTNLGGNNIIEALGSVIKSKNLPAKQLSSVSGFHKLLTDLDKTTTKKNLREIIKQIIVRIKYADYLKEYSFSKTNDYENLEDRLENLKELQAVASKYDELPGKEGIEKFLEEITLLQDTDRVKSSADNHATSKQVITLMTIHASKGLEFPVVFIVGMEEGLFPHSRTVINPHELEEERRLCYVAITRAKNHLILTYTKYRRIFGSSSATLPSRFILEIPRDLIDYELINDFENEEDEKIYY